MFFLLWVPLMPTTTVTQDLGASACPPQRPRGSEGTLPKGSFAGVLTSCLGGLTRQSLFPCSRNQSPTQETEELWSTGLAEATRVCGAVAPWGWDTALSAATTWSLAELGPMGLGGLELQLAPGRAQLSSGLPGDVQGPLGPPTSSHAHWGPGPDRGTAALLHLCGSQPEGQLEPNRLGAAPPWLRQPC